PVARRASRGPQLRTSGDFLSPTSPDWSPALTRSTPLELLHQLGHPRRLDLRARGDVGVPGGRAGAAGSVHDQPPAGCVSASSGLPSATSSSGQMMPADVPGRVKCMRPTGVVIGTGLTVPTPWLAI